MRKKLAKYRRTFPVPAVRRVDQAPSGAIAPCKHSTDANHCRKLNAYPAPRVFSSGLRSLPSVKRLGPAHIARQVKTYINWGLIIMLVTGVLLFLSEALKCYDNDAFFPKMQSMCPYPGITLRL